MISSSQRPLPDNTRQSQQTNIHAPGGIRTHDLSRRAAAGLPPGAWIFVCCECRVLSGRGLCDELITRLEESYRLWCVVVCDLETSRMRRPWPAVGRSATAKKNVYKSYAILVMNSDYFHTEQYQFDHCRGILP